MPGPTRTVFSAVIASRRYKAFLFRGFRVGIGEDRVLAVPGQIEELRIIGSVQHILDRVAQTVLSGRKHRVFHRKIHREGDRVAVLPVAGVFLPFVYVMQAGFQGFSS